MAVAVISEFNPFHNGHAYLINEIKRLTNEPVIAVMSGSFTQRGEVALTDKYSRAKTALENGVDLVIELPCAYAVSNAQRFAYCGVHIAKSFGCVNRLAFGCECGSIEDLKSAVFAAKDSRVNEIVALKMNEGDYYPRALQFAVKEVYGDKTAQVFSSPNNILAVEYLKNLSDSNITPLAIKRKAVAHDSADACGKFASASFVRSAIRRGESAEKYLPSLPAKITNPKNLERAVLYKLRTMSAADFALLPDVKEGLENRIAHAVKNYNSVNEIIDFVKTKRYTHARLRRIITCALLGITEKLQTTPIEYARVLGFTNIGASLLKSCRLEVISSVSKADKSNKNILDLLSADISATDIAALAYDEVYGCSSDYKNQIVKV